MREGWETKKLGEVCEIVPGQSPEGKSYNSAGHGVPLYQGKKDFGARTLGAPTTWTTQPTKTARAGDIVMSVRAPVGPVNIVPNDVCIGRGLSGIRCLAGIDRDFLFYQLRLIEPVIRGQEGAVFASISKSQIEALTITVTRMAEQRRIVAILDEAFAEIDGAKANAESNLENARALFENELEIQFANPGPGWIERPLSELCDIKHGFAFKSEFFAEKGDYVLLTPGNFYEAGGYRDRGEKQKYYVGEIPAGFVLSKGDLLVAMTEQAAGLLGSPIIVPESGKFLHNQRLGLVVRKNGVPWTNEFFFHVFNLRSVRQAIHDDASGVKVRHTSPSKIGKLVVTFAPTIAEQRNLVKRLNAVREEGQRLSSLYSRKLAALEELKKSLLHQAFTGELTARAPAVAVGAPTARDAGAQLSTTDLHAGILAIAFEAHERAGKAALFGHVKAEKIAHMIEAHLGIDLGRRPVKDAAGPNDYLHLKLVESRARKAGWFDFVPTGERYEVKKPGGFDRLVARTRASLGERIEEVDRLINLMLPLDTRRAEILCTVYAAWNNLLLQGRSPTEDEIVRAAREEWHPEKLNIPGGRFFDAIGWMRKQNITPSGRGKVVGPKVSELDP